MRSGSDRRQLSTGDDALTPAGTPHNWGNGRPKESHAVVRLTSALRIEEFFEAFCSVAEAGLAGNSGLPRNPLQLAVILNAFRREFAFAEPWQQALRIPLLSLAARIGRRSGFTSKRITTARRAPT